MFTDAFVHPEVHSLRPSSVLQINQGLGGFIRNLPGLVSSQGFLPSACLLQIISEICNYSCLQKEEMEKYLGNRHYFKLTKLLPEQMRTDQLKYLYLSSHNVQNGLAKKGKAVTHDKFYIQESKETQQSSSFHSQCCPVCHSNDNITVEYHGKNHICVKCRKFIRDEHGNQVKIFTDNKGEIVCLGLIANKLDDNFEKKKYYYTDYTKLEINGQSVFATFAAPDEMVLIVRNGV